MLYACRRFDPPGDESPDVSPRGLAMTATRRLILLRHAKSDWPDVPDRDRPLAKRGRRDAPNIGRWLRDHGVPARHRDLLGRAPHPADLGAWWRRNSAARRR